MSRRRRVQPRCHAQSHLASPTKRRKKRRKTRNAYEHAETVPECRMTVALSRGVPGTGGKPVANFAPSNTAVSMRTQTAHETRALEKCEETRMRRRTSPDNCSCFAITMRFQENGTSPARVLPRVKRGTRYEFELYPQMKKAKMPVPARNAARRSTGAGRLPDAARASSRCAGLPTG